MNLNGSCRKAALDSFCEDSSFSFPKASPRSSRFTLAIRSLWRICPRFVVNGARPSQPCHGLRPRALPDAASPAARIQTILARTALLFLAPRACARRWSSSIAFPSWRGNPQRVVLSIPVPGIGWTVAVPIFSRSRRSSAAGGLGLGCCFG